MNPTRPYEPINPVALAEFVAQPGAARLIEIFASLPNGPAREGLISMAEGLAVQFGSVPAMSGKSGLQGAAIAPLMIAAPGPRHVHTLTTADPGVEIVKLLLEGRPAHEVAEQVGLRLSDVTAARAAARKAGVKFPAQPKPKKRKKGAPPPFTLTLEGVGAQGIGSLAKAAENRGITLDAYMARRRLALKMGLEGRHIRAIIEATGETQKTLQTWFYALRGNGHAIPFMFDAAPAFFVDKAQATAEVIQLNPPPAMRRVAVTFSTSEGELTARARAGAEATAGVLKCSVAELMTKRAYALAAYRRGARPTDVAKAINVPRKMAENWKTLIRQAGLLDTADASQEAKV